MRVMFNNHIDECKRIRHPDDSKLLLITTEYNEVYTVDCLNINNAKELYDDALHKGYIDVSSYEYSN